MNGFQRINAALSGEWPDKVPVMLHNFMPAAREAGLTQAQFREDPELAADAFIRSVEKYELDGVLVDLDTATLAGAVGVPVAFPIDAPAIAHGGCLPTLEAVRDLPPIDLASYRYVQHWLEITRRVRAHFGDEVYLRGNCDQAPFSLACAMRTPAEFMMDLCEPDNFENIGRLLSYCTAVTCQFICLMAETGAHMVSNGDSPAGPAMISPTMYSTFALPAEKAVVTQAHALGLRYGLHICGDTSAILAQMLESGTDAVEIDYKTDLKLAHRTCREKSTFIGNIDPSEVMARGTPRAVKESVTEVLRTFADTPRFILNAGCALPATTPEASIRALVQTARHFR